MKTRILILAFGCVMAVLCFCNIANAVTSAPSPYCQITAGVISVERKSSVSEMAPEIINEYYAVKLNISDISTFQQEGDRQCDNAYLEIVKNYGFILNVNAFEATPILPGQRISGVIHFSGDEFSSGYSLTNIEILDDQASNINLNSNELNLNIPLIEMGRDTDRQIINWYYAGPLVVIFILLIACFIVFAKLMKK